MTDYNANSLVELSSIDAIRKRPELYTTVNTEHGCHHIFAEALDNACDEVIEGHASKIIITLEGNTIISIEDDGRGMPVDTNRKTGMSGVDMILTRLNAGGKFDKKIYQVSGGLHGQGAAVMNAMSEWLEVTVKREGTVWSHRYRRGIPEGKIKKTGECPVLQSGTKIRLTPDFEMYEVARFDPMKVREMLVAKAVLLDNLTIEFHLNDTIETIHYADGIDDYHKELSPSASRYIKLSGKSSDGVNTFTISFALDVDDETRSFANTIPTTQHGSHHRGYRTGMVKALVQYADGRGLIPKDCLVSEADLFEHTSSIISLFFDNVAFSSQTKEKLSSRSAQSFCESITLNEFRDHLLMHGDNLDEWIGNVIGRAVSRMKKARREEQIELKSYTGRTVLPGKLSDCDVKDRSKAELFIVEGDSAGGSVKQARNRRTQALLPMKGKITNIHDLTNSKALSSESIMDIIIAIGAGYGEQCKPEKSRYGKIIFLTDADVDGAHIRCLLWTMFYRLAPELLQANMVFIGQTPLFKVSYGKESDYALTEGERDRLISKGKKAGRKCAVVRFKGLGEMSPSQLEETVMLPENRILIPVLMNDCEFVEIMNDLMGKLPDLRRKFLECYSPTPLVGDGSVDDSILQFKNDYMDYAIYTITYRAIPDVRDGLKPVHRRILYSLYRNGCRSSGKTYKSARIVGDVIGKYHPHGDTAVYDAMVRMAQPWSMRHPLVFGQGNFGSIDGDSPAAMRYSEVKLSPISELVVHKELDMTTVSMVPNYDASMEEPSVLPTGIPSLIINGISGIAVSMTSDFIPHNLIEAMEASIKLLKKKDSMYKHESDASLVYGCISGPDLPTGGVIVTTKESMRRTYDTGSGSFTCRSKYNVEHGNAGAQIVITEFPYGIKKQDVVLDIARRIDPPVSGQERKSDLFNLIKDICDESGKTDIRVVIKPKNKKIDPDQLMMHLYAVTRLQVNITVNMNALIDNGKHPKQLSLTETLLRFVEFRDKTVCSSAIHKQIIAVKRIEIIDGLLVAMNSIDQVIQIIRESDAPEFELTEIFELLPIQVAAIINMRLRALKKMETNTLKDERMKLKVERDELNRIINDDIYRHDKIVESFQETIKTFGDARRTEIQFGSSMARTIDISAIVLREPVSIAITRKGWIRTFKGRADPYKAKLNPGDEIWKVRKGFTNQRLVLISKTGRSFCRLAGELPDGKHVTALLTEGLKNNDQIFEILMLDPDMEYVVCTNVGQSFRLQGKNFITSASKGKQIVMTDSDVKTITIKPCHNANAFLYVAKDRIGIIMKENIAKPVSGKGKGVHSLRGAEIRRVIPVTIDGTKVILNGVNLNLDLNRYGVKQGRTGVKTDARIISRLLGLD